MNRRLTNDQIRTTCRELVADRGPVPGRELRRELRRRYGTPGSTSRVFRLWREVLGTPQAVSDFETTVVARARVDVEQALRRVEQAERERSAAVERAERAEVREQAHQARWAREVDALRVELAQTGSQRERIRQLEETVLRLSRELVQARGRRPDGGEGR